MAVSFDKKNSDLCAQFSTFDYSRAVLIGETSGIAGGTEWLPT